MLTKKDMSNTQVAQLLRQIAAVFEVKGSDRFRQIAYEKAAENIEHLSKDIKTIHKQGKLQQIPGVGKHLSDHLTELFEKGKVQHFESLTKDLPQGMFPLLDVPGIGPKTAFKLASTFKLNDPKTAVKRLKTLAKQGKIQNLENFGKISEIAILDGIKEKQSRTSRVPIDQAQDIANKLKKYLSSLDQIKQINTLGSLRRRKDTVGDVDLAVATSKPKSVIDHFVSFPERKRVLAKGTNTARILVDGNVQVDLKTQTPEKYGAMLQHFTGSKAHNVKLRELAMKKGLSLSEYGIKNKNNKIKTFSQEEKFYNSLGLDWIPPELREGQNEIEKASMRKLPKLVELKDIKGDLHTHTNHNWISSHDAGLSSMQEMVNKAAQLSYQYIALGDHNPSISSYSNTKLLSLIKDRKNKIDKLKSLREAKGSKRPIKILNTLEIDIRANGSLSLPDKAVDMLDFATVSVHSSMKMKTDKMTQRVLAGLSHSKALILGHPTGRLINKRSSYQLNWDKIFDFCARNNKVIEINAHPKRLDLPDILVKEAIKSKVMLAINTDAHSTEHLDLMAYGLSVARRGWAQKKHILNTLTWNKLRDKINLS